MPYERGSRHAGQAAVEMACGNGIARLWGYSFSSTFLHVPRLRCSLGYVTCCKCAYAFPVRCMPQCACAPLMLLLYKYYNTRSGTNIKGPDAALLLYR